MAWETKCGKAICYAILVYLSAYLKLKYPTIYMKHYLSNVFQKDDLYKIQDAVKESKRLGIQFVTPSINNCTYEFQNIPDTNNLYIGMCALKGFGHSAELIEVHQGSITSLEYLYDNKGPSKTAMVPAILAGLFDTLYPKWTRPEIMAHYFKIKKEKDKRLIIKDGQKRTYDVTTLSPKDLELILYKVNLIEEGSNNVLCNW